MFNRSGSEVNARPHTFGGKGHAPTHNGRYRHIDALRAFAVMLVVVAHTDIGGIPGGSGVTIFFTISGFIITHLLLKERSNTAGFYLRGFYYRRCLKLAPPFLVIIALPTLVYSIWNPISWNAFAMQVFFIFNWADLFIASPIHILPGSSVVWSLSIEEQFYICFSLMWFFIVRSQSYVKKLIILASACVILSFCLRVIYVLNGVPSSRIYGGTETRLDAIAIGILTAVIFFYIDAPRLALVRRVMTHDAVPLIAASIYVLSLLIRDPIFRDTLRYFVQALAAAAVVLYGLLPSDTKARRVFERITSIRLVQMIGLASYSMYLLHAPLMHLMAPFADQLPQFIRVIMLVLIGVSGGVLAWGLIERPVEAWKKKRGGQSTGRIMSGGGAPGD